MGCPSPASVLVQLARQAASQEVLSDTEDDTDLLSRAVGAPRSWLEEALESSSDAASDSEEASYSHAQPVSSSECLSSALHVHLQQQQQVWHTTLSLLTLVFADPGTETFSNHT